MKKIFTSIIIALTLLSSTFSAYANSEGTLSKLLDLKYGPEEFNLSLSEVDTSIRFRNSNTNNLLTQFDKINEALKEEIIRKYRSGELTHHRTNAIISSHKNFVYYSNDLFKYVKLKEENPNYSEANDFILKSYRNARMNYLKVRHLIR